ncbi:uncharacterized protein BDR25DRAFT_356918 [Lindgomyces ingoldianus]|uniref:Uncharacterized protein n=1 Tax=Lindgomyces ingoldianus TaxID=673940 RepID=A0ACB6QSS7_9PLEO|nr:uncharacterized protein BDR25DRAFT_356918 [Lindgomyces ingoldianus]KAF2469132.1 hypothetical protein BDR25DRAFT_356918 [Lindgomyces ingoldianus]
MAVQVRVPRAHHDELSSSQIPLRKFMEQGGEKLRHMCGLHTPNDFTLPKHVERIARSLKFRFAKAVFRVDSIARLDVRCGKPWHKVTNHQDLSWQVTIRPSIADTNIHEDSSNEMVRYLRLKSAKIKKPCASHLCPQGLLQGMIVELLQYSLCNPGRSQSSSSHLLLDVRRMPIRENVEEYGTAVKESIDETKLVTVWKIPLSSATPVSSSCHAEHVQVSTKELRGRSLFDRDEGAVRPDHSSLGEISVQSKYRRLPLHRRSTRKGHLCQVSFRGPSSPAPNIIPYSRKRTCMTRTPAEHFQELPIFPLVQFVNSLPSTDPLSVSLAYLEPWVLQYACSCSSGTDGVFHPALLFLHANSSIYRGPNPLEISQAPELLQLPLARASLGGKSVFIGGHPCLETVSHLVVEQLSTQGPLRGSQPLEAMCYRSRQDHPGCPHSDLPLTAGAIYCQNRLSHYSTELLKHLIGSRLSSILAHVKISLYGRSLLHSNTRDPASCFRGQQEWSLQHTILWRYVLFLSRRGAVFNTASTVNGQQGRNKRSIQRRSNTTADVNPEICLCVRIHLSPRTDGKLAVPDVPQINSHTQPPKQAQPALPGVWSRDVRSSDKDHLSADRSFGTAYWANIKLQEMKEKNCRNTIYGGRIASDAFWYLRRLPPDSMHSDLKASTALQRKVSTFRSVHSPGNKFPGFTRISLKFFRDFVIFTSHRIVNPVNLSSFFAHLFHYPMQHVLANMENCQRNAISTAYKFPPKCPPPHISPEISLRRSSLCGSNSPNPTLTVDAKLTSRCILEASKRTITSVQYPGLILCITMRVERILKMTTSSPAHTYHAVSVLVNDETSILTTSIYSIPYHNIKNSCIHTRYYHLTRSEKYKTTNALHFIPSHPSSFHVRS